MKLFLAIATVFILSLPVMGSDGYVLGTDGYWRYGAGVDRYIRTVTPAYWQNGYYYQAQVTYTLVPNPLPSPATVNWRSELLKFAADKLRAEQESRDYANAIQLLGLNVQQNQIGYQGSFSQFTATGSTLYGSPLTYKDLYGDANLGILYQQAGRSIDSIAKLLGDANVGVLDLASQEGENRATVARILAAGQAIAQASASQKATSENLQSVNPLTANPWEKSALNKCSSCHSPTNKAGGFDVFQFRALDKAGRLKVISRLVDTNPSRRMPKDHEALSREEIGLWIREAVK